MLLGLIKNVVNEYYPYEININNLELHPSDHAMLFVVFHDLKTVRMAFRLEGKHPGNETP